MASRKVSGQPQGHLFPGGQEHPDQKDVGIAPAPVDVLPGMAALEPFHFQMEEFARFRSRLPGHRQVEVHPETSAAARH